MTTATAQPEAASGGAAGVASGGAMPSLAQRAVETIDRMATRGCRSSLMKLPRDLLNDLAVWLATPGSDRSDTHKRLAEELGRRGLPGVPDITVDRFAQQFRADLEMVHDAWAGRLVIAGLQADPDYREDDLHRVVRQEATRVLARRLAAGDADDKLLRTVLESVRLADRRQIDHEKLELDRAEAERREQRLAADLVKAEHEAQILRQQAAGIPQAVKALTRRFEELQARSQRREQIPAELFAAIRQELLGLTPPDPASEPTPAEREAA